MRCFDNCLTILTILSRGKKLIDLPYTVKGMDVSFSGILSYIEVSLLSYSIQGILQPFLLAYQRQVSFMKRENLSKQEKDKHGIALQLVILVAGSKDLPHVHVVLRMHVTKTIQKILCRRRDTTQYRTWRVLSISD